MNRTRRSVLAGAGAAALASALHTSRAETIPAPVLLGRQNRTSTTTLLLSTSSKPALEVASSGGQALKVRGGLNVVGGLGVTSRNLVPRLNADMVDGQHASAFASSTHQHDDYARVAHAHAPDIDTGWIELYATSYSTKLLPDGPEGAAIGFQHGIADFGEVVVGLEWQDRYFDSNVGQYVWIRRSVGEAAQQRYSARLNEDYLGYYLDFDEGLPPMRWYETGGVFGVVARARLGHDSEYYRLRLRLWIPEVGPSPAPSRQEPRWAVVPFS